MRITDLPNLTTGSFDDYLYIIDVSDTGSFFSGSSKKIKLGKLMVPQTTLFLALILIAIGSGLFYATRPKKVETKKSEGKAE